MAAAQKKPGVKGESIAFLERRKALLEMRSDDPQRPENYIAPNAPWKTFIDARSRALSAFALVQDAKRQRPASPSSSSRDLLCKAYIRFSRALDRVTVPMQYWSELPHEDVKSGKSHAALLSVLDELEARLLRIAGVTPPEPLEIGGREESEEMLEELAEWVVEQAGLLEKQRTVSPHAFARLIPNDPPAWPHDGSIPRV
ncbi:hypothetical protein JCM10450v2_000994 [Rhodotorula kratochvilovae]